MLIQNRGNRECIKQYVSKILRKDKYLILMKDQVMPI